MNLTPDYYSIEGGKLPSINPAEWAETDQLDLVYNRTTRTVFFVRLTNDWKAAARCMLALDRLPEDLPALSRQAIAFWWHKGPLGEGPRPF